MAEENTTVSTPTPEPPADPNPSPAPASENTSTTTPSEQPTPDGEALPDTILTAKSEGEEQEDGASEVEDKAEANPLHGAPEGDYEISLPEGMEVDKAALEVVAPVAKELNLSNEGFNKLVGVYAEKVLPAVQSQITEGIERAVAAKHAEWAGEAQKMIAEDPVFEGKKMTDVQRVAAKTLDRFFGAETRQFLAETGLGNYPQLVKGMYLIGTLISEDTTFERGGAVTKPKSVTEKFYGS